MIPNLSSLPPSPFNLKSISFSKKALSDTDINSISCHFPTRRVREFTEQRQVEHLGVVSCIEQILRHNNWHLLYGEDGAPILYEYHKPSSKSITITHANIEDQAFVFVSTSERNGEKIGLDLTVKGDSRLQRIAPRTMNSSEVEAERFEEIWAIKEAMFKALGPGIDFKDELQVDVDDIKAGKEYVKATFNGSISRWWVAREDEFVLALGPC